MNIVKGIVVAIVLSLAPGLAHGGEVIALTPADQQRPADWPYSSAELHMQVDSASASSATAVQLRWQLGGPTFVYPLTLLPDSSQTVFVALPAMRLQQVYDIVLKAGREDVLRTKATIVWPAEWVNEGTFIDPRAHLRHEGPLPRWPSRLKRGAWLAAAAMCVALAGAIFIRRRWVQLGVLATVVLVAAILAGVWLHRQPAVVARMVEDGDILILTARRTVEWRSESVFAPVYVDIHQAAADSMVVGPGGVTLTLDPQQAVLLRRVGKR